MEAALADRLAIIDVVNLFADLMDGKEWGRFDEVLTEDVVAVWGSPDRGTRELPGRDAVVGAMKDVIKEVETFHHIASFTPTIYGDTATVTLRIRAMHSGRGLQEGEFYESLGRQPSTFVRTPDGWRISRYRWEIVHKFGDIAFMRR